MKQSSKHQTNNNTSNTANTTNTNNASSVSSTSSVSSISSGITNASGSITLSRTEALKIIRGQKHDYFIGDKRVKGEILDNLEKVLHRPRKSLIRTMNHEIQRKRQKNPHTYIQAENARKRHLKPGRPKKYSAEADAALAFIWEAYNYPCAERLHPELNEAIRIFIRDECWPYGTTATEQLADMSKGAMKVRLVKFAKSRGLMRGFSVTRSSDLLNSVPIFHGDWSTKPTGYGQVDTVVHAGEKLQGKSMVYTVNFTEMRTYWVELVAQQGKTAETTRESLITIAKNLPINLRGLHPDSGDEFINKLVISWVHKLNRNRKPEHRIELSRSRPSKKNDNCNVEDVIIA